MLCCCCCSAGEGGESNTAYYLASGFERILLQPCGDLNLLGYKVHSPFLRGLLDKLGVAPQFVQRKEYKNAANMFTETRFTPAHRESMTAILSSIYATVVQGIAQGRGQSALAVEQAMADGPFTAEQARDRGLVDELVYENDLVYRLKHTPPKSHPLDNAHRLQHPTTSALSPSSSSVPSSPSSSQLSSERVSVQELNDMALPLHTKVQRFDLYAQQALARLQQRDASNRMRGAPKIALIYGLGNVVARSSTSFPTPGAFHSSTLSKAIMNAARDPRVHVILLRVDSPGGSYVAADTVHAALKAAKAQGKKVVVSMGGLAASGGYFAAAPADVIFANDATLTGSIGVFGGKLAVRQLMEGKIGVTFDTLQVGGGESAGLFSMVDPWTPGQLKRMNDMMDRIYADFVSKVAAGRGMSYASAEAIAKGRVWTGEQAKRIGLVDELGGMYDAVQRCRAMIDPSLSNIAVLETLPKKKGLLALLMEAAGAGDAEKDDRPLFTQAADAGGGVRGLLEQAVKEGVGMLEANMVKELQAAVTGGGGSVGGLGVSVHAGDGVLGESGLLDSHGRLAI